MDESFALIITAAISAVVAVGTFAAAEVVKVRRSARVDRASAVLRLLRELERVPREVKRRDPWWIPNAAARRFDDLDLDLGSTGLYLYAYLPRRDWLIVKWLGWRLDAMTDSDRLGRVVIAADLHAVFVAYLSQPRRARRYVRRFKTEIDQWFDTGFVSPERRADLGR
jgi:hypothetical protein